MAQEEKYGTRDRTYSAWHRRNSIRRFVGIESAQTLAMIDLDAAVYVEYDDASKEPLSLIETARDVGQSFKSAAVTKNLARKAGIPAFVLLYTPNGIRNPADDAWPDIASFRVRRIWRTETEWRTMSPDDWAKFLVRLRQKESSLLDEAWKRQLAAVNQ